VLSISAVGHIDLGHRGKAGLISSGQRRLLPVNVSLT
jgi:hypothetical protein